MSSISSYQYGLRFIRPLIPDPDAWTPYLASAYRARHFSNFGPAAALFETGMAERFANGRSAISVSNCTAGLVAALHGLGITGKVVIPSFTFAATAHAVLQSGCTPLLCDIDPITLHLCPAALESLLKDHEVGGIMPVRALGLWDSLEPVISIADSRSIPVVIDAAPTLGAPKQPASSPDHVEVFSLHATKTFAIGEGGVVFAPSFLEGSIRSATNFGIVNGDVMMGGANAKLSEFQAAIGLAVLASFTSIVERRSRIAARYNANLSQRASVERVWNIDAASWATFPLLLKPGIDQQAIISTAARSGVELRSYYQPLHQMRYFAGAMQGPLQNTESVARRTLCLPIYTDMTDAEQDKILSVLADVME